MVTATHIDQVWCARPTPEAAVGICPRSTMASTRGGGEQWHSLGDQSVNCLRCRWDVCNVTDTAASVHRHRSHLASRKHRWWLWGPTDDFPMLVPVRAPPHDAVRPCSRLLLREAQHAMGGIWPALAEDGRVNRVVGSR